MSSDPSTDKVGTVRQSPGGTIVVRAEHGSYPWMALNLGGEPYCAPDDVVAAWPVIGACPGTPAVEGQGMDDAALKWVGIAGDSAEEIERLRAELDSIRSAPKLHVEPLNLSDDEVTELRRRFADFSRNAHRVVILPTTTAEWAEETDPETGCRYITITRKPVTHTREIADGVNVDLDASGHVAGIEVLADAYHWGASPSHCGLTKHRGPRERCGAPECEDDGAVSDA